MRRLSMCLLVMLLTFSLQAQNESSPAPIIFIYDASGSMWGQMDGKAKVEIATSVLSTSINNLPENQSIGLVAYGHRKKGDCKDVETLVTMDNNSKGQITSALKNIKPLGKTPLAYSASLVIDQLRKSKERATIILITDGIESCDGNICDVVETAKAEGIDFKLHIVGFGLKEGETKQLQCAANAGDGNYYDAANANGLSDVLNEVTQQTIDKPEGNVTVYAIKNGIAIDAWVKAYDIISKRKPIAIRTYADTASFYLPPSTYNFEVAPLEGSDVNSVTVTDIKSFDDQIVHKTISFDGGKIALTTTNNNANWDCIVKVMDSNGKLAASLRTYNGPKETEVNPGTYSIKIQALGSMKGLDTHTVISNVKVIAGETVERTFNFVSGTIFIETIIGGTSVDSIVTISEANSGKNVASGRTYNRGKEFLLNPGNYEIKVKPLGEHKNFAAQEFPVAIKPGESITKTVQY
ncbi:MAG: VWA domain-containing protein [Bacteroidota bacterium]